MNVEFNTVEECLEALRNGEIILVTDDADTQTARKMIISVLEKALPFFSLIRPASRHMY